MRWKKKGREKKDVCVGPPWKRPAVEQVNASWTEAPTCRFRKTIRQFGREKDTIAVRNGSARDKRTDMSLKKRYQRERSSSEFPNFSRTAATNIR
ncbi:hypothetical protein PUN28_010059 [Cardiocondyla obscurior]|uniref:Uncharacterized protein n=1 Tax=Cardiocondyla obscurior TaxID=286306 RepID=A0AAW2FP63_9HYME